MRSDRALLAAGSACLLIAAAMLLVGRSGFPLLPLGALGLGAVLLVVGLGRARGTSSSARTRDPARGERIVRIAFSVLAGLAFIATVVAILVAVGEARGHAVFHLLTGLVCLGLFAALAFPWHPAPGSGTAMPRGMVLTLLALAAAGSFLESLGGSGYDAANPSHRIQLLASLHAVGLPFGAFVMAGVPIGIVTGIAVLIGHVIQWRQPPVQPAP
jgi:hypothetical protein